jgi:hypothetical protein
VVEVVGAEPPVVPGSISYTVAPIRSPRASRVALLAALSSSLSKLHSSLQMFSVSATLSLPVSS